MACFLSSSPIPPPPPISLPVWSLAAPMADTKADPSSTPTAATSMNIVTYAVPVSVAAPKLWVVSLYHGTRTKDALLSSGRGVLQLLAPAQKNLVVLGKRSGYDLTKPSKADTCAALGFSWTRRHPFATALELLPRCVSYVELVVKDSMEAGDHVAVLCEVVGTGTWDDAEERVLASTAEQSTAALDQRSVLYSGQLREDGLI